MFKKLQNLYDYQKCRGSKEIVVKPAVKWHRLKRQGSWTRIERAHKTRGHWSSWAGDHVRGPGPQGPSVALWKGLATWDFSWEILPIVFSAFMFQHMENSSLIIFCYLHVSTYGDLWNHILKQQSVGSHIMGSYIIYIYIYTSLYLIPLVSISSQKSESQFISVLCWTGLGLAFSRSYWCHPWDLQKRSSRMHFGRSLGRALYVGEAECSWNGDHIDTPIRFKSVIYTYIHVYIHRGNQEIQINLKQEWNTSGSNLFNKIRSSFLVVPGPGQHLLRAGRIPPWPVHDMLHQHVIPTWGPKHCSLWLSAVGWLSNRAIKSLDCDDDCDLWLFKMMGKKWLWFFNKQCCCVNLGLKCRIFIP